MPDPLDPLTQPGARRLFIFGHPSHELALYGLLQRHPPDAILIITDGGGPHREQHSRDGLGAIGLLERTEFLHFPEGALYEALLEHRVELFHDIVGLLRERIEQHRPHQVFCDAVEFYNPVHDVTLPMVLAALDNHPEISLYEIPLVYQQPEVAATYHIQRVPPVLADRRVRYQLSPEECANKVHARDSIYDNLREQAGPEFMELPPAHLGLEEFLLAGEPLPDPETSGKTLRYEERAKKLKSEGAIDRMITYRDHFLPIARNIISHASPVRTGAV